MFCRLLPCCTKPYVADSLHYLAVRYLNGHVEHLDGPCQLHFNAYSHEAIELREHVWHIATEKHCVEVVHLDGRFERLLGPTSLRFDPLKHKSASVKELRRHVACQSQYLVVQHRDGRKEHMRGPVELIQHPLEHESIQVQEAHRLAANEAIVVYRRCVPDAVPQAAAALTAKVQKVPASSRDHSGTGGTAVPLLVTEPAGREGTVHVERRVVHGPSVFMPESTEWLHTFSWHGTPPSSGSGKGSKTGYAGDLKVPHALEFQVVRCMPDQIYVTVRDVRTTDDANLAVHLMLFYELKVMCMRACVHVHVHVLLYELKVTGMRMGACSWNAHA